MSTFQDSSSTLGDHDHDYDDSERSMSRWDHEEVPAFPLPLYSSRISPKLPQRQRTFEGAKQDMMAMMMMTSDAIDGIVSSTSSRGGGGVSQLEEDVSVTTPSYHEQDGDCPKQLDMMMTVEPPTLPRRQISGCKNHHHHHAHSPLRRSSPHSTSNRRALAQMRFQCLQLRSSKHRQNSKRSMLVVDDQVTVSSDDGPERYYYHPMHIRIGSGGTRASTI